MTREDIIRMARQAGMERVINVHKDGTRTIELPHPYLLERFAALVAAHEREACTKLCDENERANLYGVKECAAAIRARGETE